MKIAKDTTRYYYTSVKATWKIVINKYRYKKKSIFRQCFYILHLASICVSSCLGPHSSAITRTHPRRNRPPGSPAISPRSYDLDARISRTKDTGSLPKATLILVSRRHWHPETRVKMNITLLAFAPGDRIAKEIDKLKGDDERTLARRGYELNFVSATAEFGIPRLFSVEFPFVESPIFLFLNEIK